MTNINTEIDQVNDEKTLENMDITILNDTIVKRQHQPEKVVPEWISDCVKVDEPMKNRKSLKKLTCLNDEMRSRLKALKFKKLFPVQHVMVPALVESWTTAASLFRPRDICVCAPTGSGKTLAYVVPLVQKLSHHTECKPNGPRVLVVVPTRDLASQVHALFVDLCRGLLVNCALIAGLKNLDKERSDLLQRNDDGTAMCKADIIVCTPGRLVEHIKNTRGLELRFIENLVIDEADRVLQDAKHDWFITLTRHMALDKMRRDLATCFAPPADVPVMQKILLSATLTCQTHLLEHFDLHWPKLFHFSSTSVVDGDVSSGAAPTFGTNDAAAVISNHENKVGSDQWVSSAPEGLDEFLVVYDKEYCRILFIVDQVLRGKMSHILCFTNTRESATRLDRLLNQFPGVRSAHLHCEQAPDCRRKLRQQLVEGKLNVLVTVDSMGRGMDIAGVRCVIQYDISTDVTTYVHRVGRTARAGLKGVAYALVSPGQVYHLKKNLAAVGRRVRMHKFATGKSFRYMNQYNAALAKLQNNTSKVEDGKKEPTEKDKKSD